MIQVTSTEQNPVSLTLGIDATDALLGFYHGEAITDNEVIIQLSDIDSTTVTIANMTHDGQVYLAHAFTIVAPDAELIQWPRNGQGTELSSVTHDGGDERIYDVLIHAISDTTQISARALALLKPAVFVYQLRVRVRKEGDKPLPL